jgi:hypothetical protein
MQLLRAARHGICLGEAAIGGPQMLAIPRRLNHFVFGIIQSGLTCAIAAAISNYSFMTQGSFVQHWLTSWLLSWLAMLPVVVMAAPAIRWLTELLLQDG